MKRGRNQRRRQGVNINRALDSNGPDVRIRGTANQIYDKYLALARDANSSGDRVKAENYLQHAEHYFRVIRAMQPQMPPPQMNGGHGEGPDAEGGEPGAGEDRRFSREQPRTDQPQPAYPGEEDDDDAPPLSRFDIPSPFGEEGADGHQQHQLQQHRRHEQRHEPRHDNRIEHRGEGRPDHRNDGQRGDAQRNEGQRNEGQRAEGQGGEGGFGDRRGRRRRRPRPPIGGEQRGGFDAPEGSGGGDGDETVPEPA